MSKIKEKIKNLEIVVLDINDKMAKTAKMSAVQTIAKHLMNLESKHTTQMQSVFELINPMCEKLQNLESRVMDLEKENKYECHNIKINPNTEVSYLTANQVNNIIKEMDRVEKIVKAKFDNKLKADNQTLSYNNLNTQTDYFLKAKNLLIKYAEKTMIKKGIEYTPVGDRFANFRPILGEKKTAIEKLIGYNAKHVQYCFMQNENASYPSDTYKRENTAIGYIFGFGKERANCIGINVAYAKYQKLISLQPQLDEDGDKIKYDFFGTWIDEMTSSERIYIESHTIGNDTIRENKEYYKQCYINELLEHWGDVFNYNVLGLAMQNTDRSKAFVVPYADRPTQEKEIKDIVDSTKNFTEYNSKLSKDELYSQLLNYIKESNLNYIIYLFAKQLERLEMK